MTKIHIISNPLEYSNYNVSNFSDCKKTAILIEIDPTQPAVTPPPLSQYGRIVKWHCSKTHEIEQKWVAIADALKRINMNRFKPRAEDLKILNDFIEQAPKKNQKTPQDPLAVRIAFAVSYLNTLFDEMQDPHWEARKAFLKKKIYELRDEGIETIFVLKGNLELDPPFLASLKLSKLH